MVARSSSCQWKLEFSFEAASKKGRNPEGFDTLADDGDVAAAAVVVVAEDVAAAVVVVDEGETVARGARSCEVRRGEVTHDAEGWGFGPLKHKTKLCLPFTLKLRFGPLKHKTKLFLPFTLKLLETSLYNSLHW
jgi:hypothetical protein